MIAARAEGEVVLEAPAYVDMSKTLDGDRSSVNSLQERHSAVAEDSDDLGSNQGD